MKGTNGMNARKEWIHRAAFAACLLLVGTELPASELSGNAALRGETVYGPGAKVPTTTIHIANTPAKPPKPRKPNNENPPEGRYKHDCQRWAQLATFRGKGVGQWKDAAGNRYYGPWQCNLETHYVLKNRIGFALRCDQEHQPFVAQGVHIGVEWTGQMVVKSADKKLKRQLNEGLKSSKRDRSATHCAIASDKGYTLFRSITTTSSAVLKQRRPVRNKTGRPLMHVGKETAYLRIPANPGQFFEMTLKNTAYSKWN